MVVYAGARRFLPAIPGRNDTAAAMATMSYLPASLAPSPLPACLAGTALAEAASRRRRRRCHATKHTRRSIQRRLVVNCVVAKGTEGSLPPQLSLLCADEIMQADCVLDS